MDKENLPKHIAIIMDGNRRWAKKRLLPVQAGHKEGAKTLEKMVRYANKIGIQYFTVYAFSTENWKRSEEEVDALMNLLKNYLEDYSKRADSENIKVKIWGDTSALREDLQKSILDCEERTKNNTGVHFNICLNYGGRDEIINATKKIAEQVKSQKLNAEDITEETISNALYSAGCPDPDLMIRTSGELRTSGFLLWQLSYTEFVFLDKYWPDFNEKDLDNCIEIYQNRNRKFGGK
ncbi:MAG: isoprenyl transferase [Clostridia bacterium]|nr:isoprenyl transferase [Clostridia bacterium]